MQVDGAGRLPSEEIVRMSWLNANVVGRLPEQRELSWDGLEKVEGERPHPARCREAAAQRDAFMRILSISDTEEDRLTTCAGLEQLGHIDFIVSCGDRAPATSRPS